VLSVAFGALATLLAALGLYGVMSYAVARRTREIGIRMALGATRLSILVQFIVESMILCLIGGSVGVLLGLGISAVLTRIAGWQAAVSPGAIALAFGFSAGVGLFFGLWPARKAAKMDPIAALRYE
jgi:putative ABC transport system permease protein